MTLAIRNFVRILLIVLPIMYEIRFICSTFRAGTSTQTAFPILESGPSPSTPAPPVHIFTRRARSFITMWNNLNQAIEAFIPSYAKQNRISPSVNTLLEQTQPFESGGGSLYGTFRLKFYFETDGQSVESSVYIKIPQLGTQFVEAKKLFLHHKEMYMYQSILPSIHAKFPHEKLFPNCYSFSRSGIIIIENLRESGFYTTENLPPHDLPMCLTVFKSLARFHASSLVQRNSFANLDRLTPKDRGSTVSNDKSFLTILSKFRKHIYPALSGRMKIELEDVVHEIDSIAKSVYSLKEDGLNVIIHGDPSYVNIFFKNDQENDSIVACKFVDFGNSRPGSPVIDLVNYSLTSVDVDVYAEYGDSMFMFYVEEFGRTLEEMKCNHRDEYEYSYEELRADLGKYKLYFVFRLIFIVPQYWTRFARVSEDEDIYDYLFQSTEYISFFKKWIEIIEQY